MATIDYLRSRAAGREHVFLSMRSNQPLTRNRHWFADAVKKAGIEHFTWHDLRHTFASRLVMAGVDLRTVQELMGHKTIQMTCRYAHLSPDHQLAAVERLVVYSAAKTAERTDTRTDTGGDKRSTDNAVSVNQVLRLQ